MTSSSERRRASRSSRWPVRSLPFELFIEAAANLQADERHEEALDILHGVPEVSRVDPLVICRSFLSLYCLGRRQAAFSLLDAALDSTPDLCSVLLSTFPAIEQDPDFALRVLNAPKNQ